MRSSTHSVRSLQFGLTELMLVLLAIPASMLGVRAVAYFRTGDARQSDLPLELNTELYSVATLVLILSAVAVLGGLAAGRKHGWRSRWRIPILTMYVLVVAATPVLAYAWVETRLQWLIDSNEWAAVEACKTYAEAQDIYRRTDWDLDGVLEYSQAITGDHSLYERHSGSGDLRLVCATFAEASLGNRAGRPRNGYYFKVLTGQGPDAPGGRKNYVSKGDLIYGYGLLAYPARYGITGTNSLIINNTGTVYQLDLGPDTAFLAETMTEYNPPPSFTRCPCHGQAR